MQGKSKTIAVVLAVLISPAAWLYTYREDGAKFWGWVGLVAVAVFLALASPALTAITSLAGFAYWVWTIVGVARRPAEWYSEYNDAPPGGTDLRRAA
jgi:hypothetical protein